jgi:hypothetical protein
MAERSCGCGFHRHANGLRPAEWIALEHRGIDGGGWCFAVPRGGRNAEPRFRIPMAACARCPLLWVCVSFGVERGGGSCSRCPARRGESPGDCDEHACEREHDEFWTVVDVEDACG